MKTRFSLLFGVILLATSPLASNSTGGAGPRPQNFHLEKQAAPALGATTTRVSVASDGRQGNGDSFGPYISADGRYITFISRASSLVDGDTQLCNYPDKTSGPPENCLDIFVHDRLKGFTERVSVASNGSQGDGLSEGSSISGDGRYVAFQSEATNLVSGDTNELTDVFVHDRQTGNTERVSLASDGSQGDGGSGGGSISSDGRFVPFSSGASNLVPIDTNGLGDVFVRDRGEGFGIFFFYLPIASFQPK